VLGNGLVGPGLAMEHLGTTGSILACAAEPVYDPDMALELYPHVMADRWVVGGSTSTAGSALAWAERVLNQEVVEAAGQPSTPDLSRPLLFLPHLAGERSPAWEPRSRGSWVGLTLEHSASDLRQAVLEGTAFSLRCVLDRMERLLGRQDRIRVSGREAANDQWLHLRANIYRRPLALLSTDEPTALGAMIVAAVGVGMYADIPEAVQQATGVQAVVEPEMDLMQRYQSLYHRYLLAAETLRPLMQRW
jgi:xylulokinase